jgi:hypothetical protein
MGFLSVHLYRANDNDQKWTDKAESALSDMESQVNFSVYTYDEGSVSIDIGSNYTEMLDNWEQYIENNGINVNQYDVHLLLVNDLGLGAGALRGGAVGPDGNQVIDNSEGTAGFANAATRFNNDCYGSEETFPPTVIHEVGHAAMTTDGDPKSFPDPGNEHSTGAVYNDGSDSVSPMQLWYTGDPCSGNAPPDDNCNGRPAEYSEGVSHQLTSCTKTEMNDTMSSF